jgi:hypothetical protein
MFIAFCSIRGKYEQAVNTLVRSFPETYKNRYIVIYQDEPEDSCVKAPDGHIEVTLQRNIYEYGTWVGVQMAIDNGMVPKDSWFLFLHDTCKFVSNPTHMIDALIITFQHSDMDIIWLCSSGQCNLCMTRKTGVSYGANIYAPLHHISRTQAIEWDHMKRNKYSPKSFPIRQTYVPYQNVILPKRNVYSDSDVERNVLYYPSVLMEKYYVHVETP